jgi:hypothetical protein
MNQETMKFIPYKKYRLYTRLSVADAKQRLREHLDSPKKWFYSSYSGKAYDGEIEADEFTIFQVGPLHLPKRPDIWGQFSTADGKTSIDVCLKLSKPELSLAACAIGFMLIIFIGVIWSSWTKTHSLRSAFFLALFLFGGLLIMYLITTINILLMANQSKKFLGQLFEAEEPTL